MFFREFPKIRATGQLVKMGIKRAINHSRILEIEREIPQNQSKQSQRVSLEAISHYKICEVSFNEIIAKTSISARNHIPLNYQISHFQTYFAVSVNLKKKHFANLISSNILITILIKMSISIYIHCVAVET